MWHLLIFPLSSIIMRHRCVPSSSLPSQPADSPDPEDCSPSPTFLQPHILVFYLPTLPIHRSPSIAQSVMTSLIIPKHPKIDAVDTGVCAVSRIKLSCCLPSPPLSLPLFFFLKLIHWLQYGPLKATADNGLDWPGLFFFFFFPNYCLCPSYITLHCFELSRYFLWGPSCMH